MNIFLKGLENVFIPVCWFSKFFDIFLKNLPSGFVIHKWYFQNFINIFKFSSLVNFSNQKQKLVNFQKKRIFRLHTKLKGKKKFTESGGSLITHSTLTSLSCTTPFSLSLSLCISNYAFTNSQKRYTSEKVDIGHTVHRGHSTLNLAAATFAYNKRVRFELNAV